MRMKLPETELLKLLPAFMKNDEAVAALCKALDVLIRGIGKRAPTLRTWDQIDHLTEAELDELAYELNIDWWNPSWGIDEKRATAKTAIATMRKRGTKQAMQMVLESVFGNGNVEEWFEYGGEPYSFRVNVNTEFTKEKFREFIGLMEKTKNVRSWFDGIIKQHETYLDMRYIGVGICAAKEVSIAVRP